MKLLLSGPSIRFRITREEFKELCSKKHLEDKTGFSGDYELKYSVKVIDTQDKELMLISTPEEFSLHISNKALNQLDAESPSKEGIVFEEIINNDYSLQCALQIDLKRSR